MRAVLVPRLGEPRVKRRHGAGRDRVAGGGRSWSGALGIVAAISGVAALLRVTTLDVQSVWLDEALTMRIVNRGFGGMLSHAVNESTPPLYYILVWAWTRLFGPGVFAFRSFSALAGSLTVPVVYLAGRRYSTAAGMWAAGLTAVSPIMFYYSQEARDYALLVLFAAAAFVAWQRALEVPRAGALTSWVVLSILATLTHYFAAFLFLAELGVLISRLGWRRAAVPTLGVGLIGLALLPLAIHQHSPGLGWITQTPLVGRIGQTAKDFVIGRYGPWGLVLAPLAAVLSAGGLLRLRRCRDAGQRRTLVEVAAVGIIAIALPALLALTGLVDVFDSRNVLAAWIPFAVLLAVGLAVCSEPRVGALLGVALCTISVLVTVGTEILPAYQRDDWRDAAQSLPAGVTGGRVIVSDRFGLPPLGVYLPSISALSSPAVTVTTRELDFLFLRSAHTGPWRPGEDSLTAPVAPAAPAGSPTGFRLAGVRRTAAYATYRFLAPAPTTVETTLLQRMVRDPEASLAFEP